MKDERMALIEKAVARSGQAAVSRELGYSASAVNQALKGTYKGSLDNMLRKAEEVYGSSMVACPVMGDISIQRCAEERRKPFGASSPQRVRLYQACRSCTARQ